METKFLNFGSRIVPSNTTFSVDEMLLPGVYSVGFDEMKKQFFLTKIKSFNQTGKIYGDAEKRAERILNTFDDRSNSTGVLLSGVKGSGKTLLTKLISIEAERKGYPTILVNESFYGEEFNNFISFIKQECVVLFDEFEKTYEWDKQQKLLTILDGTYNSKKLFLLTVNDSSKLEENLDNRPGRIFYNFNYDGIEEKFIREYCNDTLNNKQHIDDVCKVAGLFSDFNFDMLQSLVEEMNRYNETASECMSIMNISPRTSSGNYYKIKVVNSNGEEYKGYTKSKYYDPFIRALKIDFDEDDEDFNEVDTDTASVALMFRISDIVDFNPDKIVYKNSKGDIATASRDVEKYNKDKMINLLL